MTDIGGPRPASPSLAPATADVCPYLLSANGGWRAATPSRDHRCTAVTPPSILTADKQRRLCLVAEHRGCSTYAAASGVGGTGDDPFVRDHRRNRRPIARTAPLVLDHGRVAMSIPTVRAGRNVGQGGLVVLMAVAFGALIIARISGGGSGLNAGSVAGGASASPSAVATPRATDQQITPTDVAPAPTLVPTEVDPTPVPGATATGQSTETTPATYTVRDGDTLSGIAGEFGTTWQVLAERNKIENPSRLRVGQVLELP